MHLRKPLIVVCNFVSIAIAAAQIATVLTVNVLNANTLIKSN